MNIHCSRNIYMRFTCVLFLLAISPLVAFMERGKEFDFDVLSGRHTRRGKEAWESFSERDRADMELLRSAFVKNFQRVLRPLSSEEAVRIPKVFHIIWVGPRPFPHQSLVNLLGWRRWHPDWTMKFWTDSEVRPCPIEGMEKHLIREIECTRLRPYIEQTSNYGEMSDCLRYEILLNEGGVYLDHDMVPFQDITRFNQAFDFYACLENPHYNPGTETLIYPGNCLIAARAGHPVLRATIDYVVECWESVEQRFSGQDEWSIFLRVINRTYHSFTRGVKRGLNQRGYIDVVLPVCFVFADQMFSQDGMRRFGEQGLLIAQHQFASIWRQPLPKREVGVKQKRRSSRKKVRPRIALYRETK